ncbi:MAG TPA: tyrosine-type recombinase/integrase [Methanospirillum sp.]|uniref:site-specific tyrosine recombinase/integron integrase n=1 Tax=Methanospirillum sp. TaxID=45200 RepID=UPI002BF461C5|nr:site-specific tyrosine recombinase/integron integrase [Methanospirillum sp.]HOJ95701.1 tyrosine-type recombinase/integrase [Methanospirillum sp.]HOL41028.1 tyrosine-type recombinase/integrase [Methanospirillum sp.]HPP77431.1 tyrosine-type recombinase/integrase [Methanospirillum sp.]
MENGYFSEWIPRFIQYLKMRNYSEKTLRSYDLTLRRFGQYLWLTRSYRGDLSKKWDHKELLRLETDVRITASDISRYLEFISSKRQYHATTYNRILSSLSSFYRFLLMQGVIDANPVPRVDRPKVKEKELKYLKHSQVMRLLQSIQDERDRLMIRIIYATGVRVSELCTMNVEDVDFDDQMIRVLGKGGKVRMVFVDEETLEEIARLIGNRLSGPLFPGQGGNHISPRTVQLIFKKYAPPGITPHKIRHSYASELYRRSRNLRVVQENLGHASIKTTEVYLHTDVDERRQVYREFFPLANLNRRQIQQSGVQNNYQREEP